MSPKNPSKPKLASPESNLGTGRSPSSEAIGSRSEVQTYQSFRVMHFRGFDDFSIDSLARVNLIAGKNNTGKTALLEALWLHQGADTPDLAMRIDRFRGIAGYDPKEFLWDIFHGFDPDKEIQLIANGGWQGQSRRLLIRLDNVSTTMLDVGDSLKAARRGFQATSTTSVISDKQVIFEYINENGKSFKSRGWLTEGPAASIGIGVISAERFESKRHPIAGRPTAIFLPATQRTDPAEDAERFGQIQRSGSESDVIDLVRRIEPRLKRLLVIPTRGVPALFGDLGLSQIIPLPLMGQGTVRTLSVALAIATVPHGMVLIDEIENGIHHSIMRNIWEGILDFASRFDVQVSATTHSRECVEAAYMAAGDTNASELALHRLERIDNKVIAMTYDREALIGAMESDFEVR